MFNLVKNTVKYTNSNGGYGMSVGSIKVGDRFAHWVILDNKPVRKGFMCECIHCGFTKNVKYSQLFHKDLDRDSDETKCVECTKLKEGSRYKTNQGFWFTVEKYIKSTNVVIRFDPDDLCPDGYVRKTTKHYINKGVIDYPLERSACGIGYMGCAKYELKSDRHIQDVWLKMLRRCYKPNKKDIKAYGDCKVCDDWLCYKTFYLWYKDQMESGNYMKGYQLDKDILNFRNKVYCPEFCRLVPEKINSFLNNFTDTRGTGLPNGVNWKEANKKYQVSIKDEYSNRKYLCITDNIEYGYSVYTKEKERIAKVLADMYEGVVCIDIINALRNFKCPDYKSLKDNTND
ncbi:hypothetical protein vBVpaMR16F_76 [Vibrio phage vB_VpaM_R16F]|nr:hypothetical protein vBVpaMR16F_76 [Vibrio phage vB_VpaM_R16F]